MTITNPLPLNADTIRYGERKNYIIAGGPLNGYTVWDLDITDEDHIPPTFDNFADALAATN